MIVNTINLSLNNEQIFKEIKIEPERKKYTNIRCNYYRNKK